MKPQLATNRTSRVRTQQAPPPQTPTVTTDPAPADTAAPTNAATAVIRSNPGPFTATPPTPDELRTLFGIKSKLGLRAEWDTQANTWKWAALNYPKDLLTEQQANREKVLFYRDIDRLLRGPPPAPWNLVSKAVVEAMKSQRWRPDNGHWLSWSLTAARHGDRAPLVRQLQLLKNDYEEEAARHQLFLHLHDHIKSGMPWSDKLAVDQLMLTELNWALSAKHELALRLLCAKGGDPEPLIGVLPHLLLKDVVVVQRTHLDELLALCQNPPQAWSVDTQLRLIDAIRPHLGRHHELHRAFDALHSALREARSQAPSDAPSPKHQRRPSARTSKPTPASKQTGKPAGKPAEKSASQALAALRPWFTLDTDGPVQMIRTSRAKAPVATEMDRFEDLLLDWMDHALQQNTHSWSDLLGVIEHLEGVWKGALARPIDREYVLDLCLEHIQRPGGLKDLLDYLPQLNDEPPDDEALLSMLVAACHVGSELQRAQLIQQLLRWVRSSLDIDLLQACAQAILSLPAGDARNNCIGRYQTLFAGGQAMTQLFTTIAQLQGTAPPTLLEALRAVPRCPPQVRRLAWRTLCQTLFARIAAPLGQELRLNNTDDTNDTNDLGEIFDALWRLAAPASAPPALAIPPLFDLIVDLTHALPTTERRPFLKGLFSASLQWTGPDNQQAILRGALQALIAQEEGYVTLPLLPMPTPTAAMNPPVIEEATVLFAYGFMRLLVGAHGQTGFAPLNPGVARLGQGEFSLRFHRSLTKTHAPDIAQLITTLFKPTAFQ